MAPILAHANIANAASGIIGMYIHTLEPFLTWSDFRMFANLQTSECNSLKEISFEFPGSSPSQIKATLSPLSSRCLSMQLSVMFVLPPENHFVS